MAFTADDITKMINDYEAAKGTEGVQEPAPEPKEPEEPVGDPAAEPEGDNPTEPHISNQEDKDANAFAQMRAQNKLYSDLLKKVADATGISYGNEDEMLQALNGDALTKLAEKKGIPVEFLQRMETLEANSRKWEEQQQQDRLRVGFQSLQSKYNLDSNAMMAFAKELDESNVDLNRVDIVREYEVRNMDSIIEQRINAAVQAALAKDADVSSHASQPAATGANLGNAEQPKVQTAAQMISLLNSLTK